MVSIDQMRVQKSHELTRLVCHLAKAGIAASSSSGIREIFGYCPTMRVDTWSPFSMKPYLLEPWVMDTLGELARKAPFGSGRVSLGFAFDGWFLPREMIVDVFAKVKEMGIKLITTHYGRSVISGEHSLIPYKKTSRLLQIGPRQSYISSLFWQLTIQF